MAGEAKLQGKIIKYLERQGAYVINIVTANRSGVHDIVFCYHGYFGSIEVKYGYNRPSALQLAHKRKVETAGGKAIVVWSLDEVKEFLPTLLPRQP